MAYIVIPAEIRQEKGSNAVKWLRRAGKLPAVLYGKTVENQSISITIDTHQFERIMATQSRNTLFALNIEGQETIVMIKEIQRHTVKRNPIHVDFIKVNMTVKQEFQVPIVLIGNAKGVKEGGVLEHVTRALTIACLPDGIPTQIEVDVTELGIGDHIAAQDLQLPENVDLQVDPLQVICTVTSVVVRDSDEDEVPAEPEVIRERKTDPES